MSWTYCGFSSIGYASLFYVYLEKNGIKASPNFDEHFGIYRVFYRPIGKKQKAMCEAEIQRMIDNDLI